MDFGSGIAVTALGHNYPAIVETLTKQGSTLLHASNLYYTQPQIDLARQLVETSFADKVFFCNSGTEAVEAALKFARKKAAGVAADKYHVLSFGDCFHGRTYGGLSATAQEKFHAGFAPIVPGFHYAPFNDIDAAREALDSANFAAIIVEPIQGEGGINAASADFLAFLREYASRHAITLIFDEIQCGMGRTGSLWSYQSYGIEPDILTAAKPLGGGLPLGATLCTADAAAAVKPGDHGTTFGGNPLACALGSVVLSIVSDPSFLAQVREKGDYLLGKLKQVCANHSLVKEFRGAGLMLGVRMNDDPQGLIAACREEGLLVIKAAHNTVRFMPPLTVTEQELDAATALFAAALEQAA
jgi:predicted acetylornithine/succinylornithine family transaminase